MDRHELDYCEKYRPLTFVEVLGQERALSTLGNMLRDGSAWGSHFLITGAYGCGKNTIARILSMSLSCPNRKSDEMDGCGACPICIGIIDNKGIDYEVLNAADKTGVDDVRSWIKNAQYLPIGGAKVKIFVVDEAHKLSHAAEAAFLNLLEDNIPSRFIFLTNQPERLSNVFKNGRIVVINLGLIPERFIKAQLIQICKNENLPYEDTAIDFIVKHADGHMRFAVRLLHTYRTELKIDVLKTKVQEFAEDSVKNLLLMIKDGDTEKYLLDLHRRKKESGEDTDYSKVAEDVMEYVGRAYLSPFKDNFGFGKEELKAIYLAFMEFELVSRTAGRTWALFAITVNEIQQAYRAGTLGSKSFVVDRRKIEHRDMSKVSDTDKLNKIRQNQNPL